MVPTSSRGRASPWLRRVSAVRLSSSPPGFCPGTTDPFVRAIEHILNRDNYRNIDVGLRCCGFCLFGGGTRCCLQFGIAILQGRETDICRNNDSRFSRLTLTIPQNSLNDGTRQFIQDEPSAYLTFYRSGNWHMQQPHWLVVPRKHSGWRRRAETKNSSSIVGWWPLGCRVDHVGDGFCLY